MTVMTNIIAWKRGGEGSGHGTFGGTFEFIIGLMRESKHARNSVISMLYTCNDRTSILDGIMVHSVGVV